MLKKISIIFISVLAALVICQSSTVLATFLTPPAQITINGTFSDWGTVSSPITGVYVCQDYSNNGEADGSGYTNKSSDINYVWMAVSTANGGSSPPSDTNLIQNLYYRIDTYGTSLSPGQSYYFQLNLGIAPSGHADHLLQLWVNSSATPNVTMVMYEYQTPYPVMGAYTTGNLIGKVSNVVNPYPGFSGAYDANASGAIGFYDGTHYAIEVKVPINWYSSLYGGDIAANGSGANVLISAMFTGTGTLGSVGTVKDTINDSFGNTCASINNTTTGDNVQAFPHLFFITSPQTITAGNSSSLITVQLQDAFGNPKTVTSNTTIALSTSSSSGHFDTSAGGAFDGSITQVTMTAGSSIVNFYYKNTTVGQFNITVAENPAQGWADATQQVTIIAGAPFSIDLSPASSSATVGNNFTLTATVRDAYGNPVPNAPITWQFSGSSTASYIYSDTVTDSDGQAHAIVTDTTAGITTFTATATGYPSATDSSDITWNPAVTAYFAITDASGNPITDQIINTLFNIMVTAYDEYGNITSYTGNVDITDLSGDINTAITLTSGTWSGSVTITGAYAHDYISATDGSISGTSNQFNVIDSTPGSISLTPDTGSATVGNDLSLTATVRDASNNPVSGASITWGFSGSSTASYIYSDTVTDSDGIAHAIVTDTTAGTTTFTATATGYPSATDSSDIIWNAASVVHFTITDGSGNPVGNQTAGQGFAITVTAYDEYGNIVTGYNGTANLSDLSGTIDITSINFTSGIWSGNVTITGAYAHDYISATDVSISGTSTLFDIAAGNPDSITLTPDTGSATVGNDLTLTATLVDAYGNPVPNAPITWQFSGSSTASYIYSDTVTDSDGIAHAIVTDTTAGTTTFTATATGYPSATDSSDIIWNAASASTFLVTNTSGDPVDNQTAGVPFGITVTAYDIYGNIATGYNGAVTLSDITGTMSPATVTLAGGTGNASITVTQAFTHDYISATDGSISGTSTLFDIAAGNPDSITLTPDTGSATVGNDLTLTATLVDAYGNPVPNAPITWQFSGSSTASYIYSDTVTDSDGIAHAIVTDTTAGTTTFTATATGYPSATDSSDITWNAASTTHFTITDGSGNPVGNQTAGQGFAITVTAYDEYGNIVTGYNGTANLSDLSGTIDITSINFTSGTWSGNVTITGAYAHDYISATDGSISGTSNQFNVIDSTPSSISLTPATGSATVGNDLTLTATLVDAYGNPVPNAPITWQFSGSSTASYIYSDTVTDSDGIAHAIVTDTTAGTTTFTATATGYPSATDSSDIIWNAASASTFLVTNTSGDPVDNQTAGVPFGITVTAYDIYGNIATTYNGTATISDLSGTIYESAPSDTSIDFTNGAWTGSVTITGAFIHDYITAIDATISGNSNIFDITADIPDSLSLTPPTGTATVGNSFSLTATVHDAYGNPVPNAPVTWQFSGSTASYTYSDAVTDSSGQAYAIVTDTTAGITTFTATATGYPSATDSSDITWNPAVTAYFAITDASGNPITDQIINTLFNIMVTAYDEYGNITSYTGNVDITDLSGDINTAITLTSGTWSGSVTITGAYAHDYISATDGSISGTSNQFNVIDSTPGSISLTPDTGSATVGNDLSLTATVRDASNNPVSGASITWGFSGSSTASYIYSDTVTDSDGIAHAIVTDTTAGTTTFTATATGYPSATDSSDIIWNAASVVHFTITDGSGNPVGNQTAGQGFAITVTAYDEYGNIVTGYNGTANLSDLSGTIDITSINFTSGTWSGNVAITGAFTHDYITVIYITTTSISNTSNPFNIVAGDAVTLDITPDSGTITAGDKITLTVTLYDNYGNIATDYTGTVQFSASDNRAILPADYTFTSADSGTHTFVSDIVLKTTGNQTITSTDILDAGLTDISNWTVNAGSTAHFIFLPIDRHQTAGTPFSVTILAVDEYGNQTDFNGDASITDQTGTFLADINVVGGMATFDVTITAAYLGDYLSVSSGSLRGTSNNFDVNAGALYSLILTPESQGQYVNNIASITAILYDQYGNPVPYANIFWQISGIIGTFTDTGTSSNSTTGDADARSTISVESAVTGISHITASSGTVWGTATIIWEETFPLTTITTTSITTSTAMSSTNSIITTSPISTITGTTHITTTTSNPATTTSPIITTTVTFPTTFSTFPLTTFTLTPTSSGTTIVTSTADNNDDIYSFLWIWGSALAGLLIIGLLIIYWRSGIYGVILCSPYQSIMKDSTVILKNSYGKIVDRFTTGHDGKYHFKHIKSGIYELNVTHSGCRTGEHSIARVHIKTLGRIEQNLEVYPLKNNTS
jgi:adhesin/invasin